MEFTKIVVSLSKSLVSNVSKVVSAMPKNVKNCAFIIVQVQIQTEEAI